MSPSGEKRGLVLIMFWRHWETTVSHYFSLASLYLEEEREQNTLYFLQYT